MAASLKRIFEEKYAKMVKDDGECEGGLAERSRGAVRRRAPSWLPRCRTPLAGGLGGDFCCCDRYPADRRTDAGSFAAAAAAFAERVARRLGPPVPVAAGGPTFATFLRDHWRGSPQRGNPLAG